MGFLFVLFFFEYFFLWMKGIYVENEINKKKI